MTQTTTAREKSVMARVARSYWLLGRILRRDREAYRLRFVPLISIHAVFPLLALIAGYADRTMYLPGRARGVLDHYGYHALFLSAPVLVYLLCRTLTALAKIISDPMPWLSQRASSALRALQRELKDAATCRSPRAKGLLLLFRTVGVFAVAANASSTRYPEIVYGQDVFDSSKHLLGYVAGRVFLAYYWVYLLPLVAYIAAVSVAIAFRLARFVDELPDYDVRCFASDGCGGFKELGRLMTLVVYLYVPIVVVLVALMETHTNFYATLKLSALLVVIIPAQLFLPFARLHRLLSRLKERKLAALERFLTDTELSIDIAGLSEDSKRDESNAERAIAPYLRLLAGESIYRHTVAISTWPYIKSDVFKWLTPFMPIMISFAVKRIGIP